nr:tetratricopeptide repeat protein [uncultured Olsenella sp.]
MQGRHHNMSARGLLLAIPASALAGCLAYAGHQALAMQSLAWGLVATSAAAAGLGLGLFAYAARRHEPPATSPRTNGLGTGEQAEGGDPVMTAVVSAPEVGGEVAIEAAAPAWEQAIARSDAAKAPEEGRSGDARSGEPGSGDALRSELDYPSLARALASTTDPLGLLKALVGDIRTRQARVEGRGDETPLPDGGDPEAPDALDPLAFRTTRVREDGQVVARPSGLELYLARRLEEAGLFSKDIRLPQVDVAVLSSTQGIYLRILEPELPYLAKLRVLAIEAALNSVRYAASYFDEPGSVSVEDCYKLDRELASSICAQMPPLDQPVPLQEGELPDGEWTVRRAISSAIENLQLPYRLEADFRCNVSDGNVAIQVELTPESVFPSSMFVSGLGVVPSTRQMRRQAASDYARRLAILLAAAAFRSSSKVLHVWFAGVVNGASTHRCYISVDFDRWRFARLDLERLDDLERSFRPFVPVMRVEDGVLRPVRQGFSLAEGRFCPPMRHLPPSLSTRRLSKPVARALGCERVYGLSIEEGDKRNVLAFDIMRRLVPASQDGSVEKNVKTILELAGDDPDPLVRSAAERCVTKLVDGSLEEDAISVGDEFLNGDALTRASAKGQELMVEGRFDEARALCEAALAPVDAAGSYEDADRVVWRYFANFVDRTLYNRLYGRDGVSLMLVPDAYFECHALLAGCHVAAGRGEDALREARRMVELAPLDRSAQLALARATLEAQGPEAAERVLKEGLALAHDPEGIAGSYLSLAWLLGQRGEHALAGACVRHLLRLLPRLDLSRLAQAQGMGLQGLALVGLGGQFQAGDPEALLEENDIPLAPTPEMSKAFQDCARASVDAEVFPVARSFVSILNRFDPSDVLTGILRSLEDAPDA